MIVGYEEHLRLRRLEGEVERVRDRAVEAVVGARVIRQRAAMGLRCSAASASFWARLVRQDRRADALGQPPVPDGWGAGRCELTWSWPNSDGYDSESCGSSRVVATDLDSEEQRCADHVAEVLEREDPYLRRERPLRLVGLR